MKKKRLAMILSVTAAAMIMNTAAVPAFAADQEADYSKNENVYVRLTDEGSVESTHVVNSFQVTKAGEITDYGDYSNVQNLTDRTVIEQKKEEYTFSVEKGKFYYQGDIDNPELPWDFDITYYLDGDKVDTDELAGEEGDLMIKFDIQKNPAYENEIFFKTYMLQVSFTLDPKLASDIKADGGTISDAGANENITFVVTPNTETVLKIQAEVEQFEMGDITINALSAAPSHEGKDKKGKSGNALSFAHADNTNVEKTSFMISAAGVEIPEQEEIIESVAEEGFMEKLIERIRSLFGGE